MNYINSLHQVIWLADNKKWAWHHNLFSMARVNVYMYLLQVSHELSISFPSHQQFIKGTNRFSTVRAKLEYRCFISELFRLALMFWLLQRFDPVVHIIAKCLFYHFIPPCFLSRYLFFFRSLFHLNFLYFCTFRNDNWINIPTSLYSLVLRYFKSPLWGSKPDMVGAFIFPILEPQIIV